jgi:putative hydrolase of the HAD superfamily
LKTIILLNELSGAVVLILKIKGIIFDFGFTLAYFEEASLKKYLDCYKKGLQRSAEYLFQKKILKEESLRKQFIRKFNRLQSTAFEKRSEGQHKEYPTSTLFQRLSSSMNLEQEIDEEIREQLTDLYHSCEQEEWIPFENTKTTLEQLSEIPHLKLAVLSNHPHHPMIQNVLRRYELLKYFDAVITSAEFGMRKPHVDIFEYTIKKMGLKKEDKEYTIMCGDEYADIMGAHRAGLRTVLIEREYKFPYEKDIPLKNIDQIKDISEILDLL